MGLRCSLLGHDFGDPEVEREREERGSEVVLTVREVAECGRCSQTKVVSENKEVTTLQEESADTDDADAESDEFEDAELDAFEEEASGAEPAPEPDASSVAEDEADAPEEDAVIMDDDAADDGRAHGEWPEPDETDEDDAGDEPTAWPTVEDEDEGFDAQPAAGGDAAVEFGGGLAPERATVEEEEGLEYVESAESAAPDDAGGDSPADDGFARADAAPVPAEPDTPDVDAEFVCPQCGFVDDVVGSSLRAGDVCPDCRKGYLAERRA